VIFFPLKSSDFTLFLSSPENHAHFSRRTAVLDPIFPCHRVRPSRRWCNTLLSPLPFSVPISLPYPSLTESLPLDALSVLSDSDLSAAVRSTFFFPFFPLTCLLRVSYVRCSLFVFSGRFTRLG